MMKFWGYVTHVILLLVIGALFSAIHYKKQINNLNLQIAGLQTEVENCKQSSNIVGGMLDEVQSIDSDYTKYSINSLYNASTDTAKQSNYTTNISTKTCNCNAEIKRALSEFYKKSLVITKDCDITATYYNNLLKYIKEVK